MAARRPSADLTRPAPPLEPGAGDRTRQTIIRSATALFAKKGFDGTRMGDIAAEAGVPRPTVYYHFATKQDLYRAALSCLIEGWDEALNQIDERSEPGPALEAYVEAKLDFGWRNPEQSHLFAIEILHGAPFLGAADRAHMREATRRAAAVIDAWVRDGKLQPVDARHLMVLLWSTTQFYSTNEILVADALDRPALRRRDVADAARTIVQIVLGGIAPR